MNRAVPDCLVTEYDHLVATLWLPDNDDRHVLAAAIVGRADLIVTFNLLDFPEEYLSMHTLKAVHPDDFLSRRFEEDGSAVLTAARKCRARLRRPAISADDYLAALERQGLTKIVRRLRQHLTVI